MSKRLRYPCERCGKPAHYLFIDDKRAHRVHRENLDRRANRRGWEPINLNEISSPAAWELSCRSCVTDEESERNDYWAPCERIATVPDLLSFLGHVSGKLWIDGTDFPSLLHRLSAVLSEPPRAAPSQTRSFSTALRFTILERDQFTCRYCGRSAPDVALHVDHIVPRVEGGTDHESNLVTACADCNLGKGRRLLSE